MDPFFSNVYETHSFQNKYFLEKMVLIDYHRPKNVYQVFPTIVIVQIIATRSIVSVAFIVQYLCLLRDGNENLFTSVNT